MQRKFILISYHRKQQFQCQIATSNCNKIFSSEIRTNQSLIE
jgi:hypothetical protein